MNNEEQPNTAFSRQHSRVRKSPMKKAPNSSKFINPGCDHLLLKSMDWFQMWGKSSGHPYSCQFMGKTMVSSRFPFSQLQRKHQLMNVPLFRHLILSCYGLAKAGDAHVRLPDGYRVNRNYILYDIYIYIYIILCVLLLYVYILSLLYVCIIFIYIHFIYIVYLLYVYNCMYIYIYVPTRIAILQLIWIEKCGHTFLVHVGARHEAVSRWNDPPTLRPCLRILLVYQVGWK